LNKERWREQLSKVSAELNEAMEQSDTSRLQAATDRLKRILKSEPSHSNTSMVNTAQLLPLSDLVQKSEKIRQCLNPSVQSQPWISEFEEKSRSLAQLDEELKDLLRFTTSGRLSMT
jgi:hypothetical protein